MAELSDRPDRTGHFLHGSIETFDLENEIQFIQNEPEYREKGHNALTLSKNHSLRNVLICLKAGVSLHEHNAPGPFNLFLVRGKVQFTVYSDDESKTVELSQSQILVMDEPQKHAVTAVEESVFLLTITKL
jgi:quercetin dioxygenase-like cupin family protein